LPSSLDYLKDNTYYNIFYRNYKYNIIILFFQNWINGSLKVSNFFG